MGSESSKEAEVTGQANTNVLVEQGMGDKVDIFHSIVLILLLTILLLQCGYVIFRQYQRKVKRKYLERAHEIRPRV